MRTPQDAPENLSSDMCMLLYVTLGCCRAPNGPLPHLLISAEVAAAVDRGERLHGKCKFVAGVPDPLLDVVFNSPNVALCELRDHLHPDHKLSGQKGGINVKANLCVDESDKKSTINQTSYSLCSLLQSVAHSHF